MDSAYDEYRMVYRLSPYELNYYPYRFWIKKPGDMMRDALFNYLSGTGAFKQVTTEYSQTVPELLLKAEIHVIEEYDQGKIWYGRLAMSIEISWFKSGDILLKHSFDRKRRLSKRDAGIVPIALSGILEEELAKLLHQLNKKLNQGL